MRHTHSHEAQMTDIPNEKLGVRSSIRQKMSAPMDFSRHLPFLIIFLIVAILVVRQSGLPNSNSDPLGTTVVSQNMLINHSVLLHGKYAKYFLLPNQVVKYQAINTPRGLEYYFPLGTPVLIMPVVAIANLLGYNALHGNTDKELQSIVVSLIIFLLLTVTYGITVIYFHPPSAAALSLFTFFGTVVGPTVGTGLWNIDIEILLISILLFLVLRYEDVDGNKQQYLLGTVLGLSCFLGFFVRPTFAVINVSLFLYMFLSGRRKLLWISATVSASLLSSFMMWSYVTYQAYLPPYYLASRLSFHSAGTAFLGLIISPSRSIFIFSPVLLFLVLNNKLLRKRQPGKRTFAGIMVSAMALLFLINVFFPHWWGGWSYGPRILSDMAYIGSIIAIVTVGSLTAHKRRKTRSLAVFFIVGVLLNWPGLFIPAALSWNALPNVDQHPSVLWDWRFPQFAMINATLLRHKCITQSKEFHIKTSACPAGIQAAKEIQLAQFRALKKAGTCFFNKERTLASLTPFSAEESGCLPQSYGAFSGTAPNSNWTKKGGWLGIMKQEIGVGVVVNNRKEAEAIIRRYRNLAQTIYFPYPNRWTGAHQIPTNSSGQLLLVFSQFTKGK